MAQSIAKWHLVQFEDCPYSELGVLYCFIWNAEMLVRNQILILFLNFAIILVTDLMFSNTWTLTIIQLLTKWDTVFIFSYITYTTNKTKPSDRVVYSLLKTVVNFSELYQEQVEDQN